MELLQDKYLGLEVQQRRRGHHPPFPELVVGCGSDEGAGGWALLLSDTAGCIHRVTVAPDEVFDGDDDEDDSEDENNTDNRTNSDGPSAKRQKTPP